MQNPLLEFIALGVRHIGEIPDLKRRADALSAAASVCAQRSLPDEASELREAAANLRQADQAQLLLNERFSQFASF